MKRLAAFAAASSLALGAISVATLASPAGAAGETVSITVAMDLPFQTDNCALGPMVFQVTDVAIGAGPELTGDGSEIVSNPCGWGGSVSVDVDPSTKQVTVASVDTNSFQTTVVTVTYPGIGSVVTTSDDLWEPAGSESCTLDGPALALLPGDAGFTASWTLEDSCMPDGSGYLAEGGAAVLTWADAAPTTTTTGAPTTTAPAVANAAAVAPAFTG